MDRSNWVYFRQKSSVTRLNIKWLPCGELFRARMLPRHKAAEVNRRTANCRWRFSQHILTSMRGSRITRKYRWRRHMYGWSSHELFIPCTVAKFVFFLLVCDGSPRLQQNEIRFAEGNSHDERYKTVMMKDFVFIGEQTHQYATKRPCNYSCRSLKPKEGIWPTTDSQCTHPKKLSCTENNFGRMPTTAKRFPTTGQFWCGRNRNPQFCHEFKQLGTYLH